MNEILSYEKELLFFQNFLKHLKVPSYTFQNKEVDLNLTDAGIHKALNIDSYVAKEMQEFLTNSVKPNTINYITDQFYCQYIILELPETNAYPVRLLSIGPYIAGENSYKKVMGLLEEKNISQQWIPILKRHFRKITFLGNEDGLIAGINTFAETIWGKGGYKSTQYLRGIEDTIDALAIPPDPQKRIDLYTNIEVFEKIYEDENLLMNAVSQGQSSKAKSILANIPLFALEQRTEAIRNLKNHTIIMNTLLRKAAEQGGVHPLYIDQLSTFFAHRIEEFTRADNFLELWNDMVQKYCLLVSTHNINKYSLPIQKVITKIDYDLSADLSLKAMAQHLNLSPSYLSNLFKEETGQTLTDYVNQKRMQHAAYLLSNTQMPVSTIAQTCGILDDNYFTKLFKRYMLKTPSKYRSAYSLTSNIKND